jgi:chromosome segregation ATPase
VRHIFIGVLLALVAATPAWAQDVSVVELQIERLRAQLRDVVDRKAQLQDRASRLEDDLRPESIERSVAAVGTTDAAALRARRLEQIEKQKTEVNAQLSEVSAKRARLESEIAAAEAEAVRLKAAALAPKEAAPRNTPAVTPATATPAPVVRKGAPARKRTPRKRNRPRRRYRSAQEGK